MRTTTLLLASGLLTSCMAESANESSHAQAVTTTNGVSLNGVSLNGVSLNGVSLNGVSLNGVSLNGVSLNGTTISSVTGTGQPLTGTAVVGSTWTATLSDGSTLPLRIDSATQGTGTNSDLWMYAISYRSSSGWSPLCGLDATNAPILALTVPGTWNAGQAVSGGGSYSPNAPQFTVACRAKSIAKCVELGYKPWAGRGKHLAACVRMLRGDYCGNGVPFTLDGQTINVYDNLGIQTDSAAWQVESEWNPNGARCIHTQGAARFKTLGLGGNGCGAYGVKPVVTTSCGTFANGTLLIDELP